MKNGKLIRVSEFQREILRKLFHIAWGTALYHYSYYMFNNNSVNALAASLFILFAILIIVDLCRYQFSLVLPFQSRWMRRHEENAMVGSTWFILGIAFAVLMFDFDIAMAGLLMLTFGDSLSALSGYFLPVPLFWRKPLINSIVGLAVNLFIGLFFLSPFVGLPMAIAATVSDIRSDIVNDNLTIPIISGLIGQIFRWIVQHI